MSRLRPPTVLATPLRFPGLGAGSVADTCSAKSWAKWRTRTSKGCEECLAIDLSRRRLGDEAIRSREGRTDKGSSVAFLPPRRSGFSLFQSAGGACSPRRAGRKQDVRADLS